MTCSYKIKAGIRTLFREGPWALWEKMCKTFAGPGRGKILRARLSQLPPTMPLEQVIQFV